MPSYLKILPSVKTPAVVTIAAAAVNAKNALLLQSDTVVTSGNDSHHMKGSRHYSDQALDLRTRDLTPAQIQAWAVEIRRRLGAGYDVVVESDHIHVEHDPHIK
jgi:hypothetical protein